MTNRALLVGINAYPSPNRLSGCINDIDDMSEYLQSACGFAAGDIQTIADKQATTANVLAALEAFVATLAPGDRALFHYSGHGAQMPTRTSGEIDGLDEVICPVDFDWSDEHAIRDDDFNQDLLTVPAGPWARVDLGQLPLGHADEGPRSVGVTYKGAGSCRRGDPGDREGVPGPEAIAVRTLTPPAKLDVGLISGCRSDQRRRTRSSTAATTGGHLHLPPRAAGRIRRCRWARSCRRPARPPTPPTRRIGTFGSHAIATSIPRA
jgi:hypothetical protein